jgi:PAS domain S-box-containing protein
LRDDAGTVERYIGIIMDITDRKQTEEALRNQSEWLRVTLTSIGDAVISTDMDCAVTFMNPAAAVLTGWSIDEGVGRPVAEVFPIFHEKTREPAENVIDRVLREGKTLTLANHTILVRRDGTETPIEDSAAPIRDRAGNVTGVVLVFHDVTERRRMLDALRESEEHFRLTFEHAPIGAAITALDHRIMRANDALCVITGYSKEELQAMTFIDLTWPEDLKANLDAVGDAVKGKTEGFRFEKRYIRKSGESIWVNVSGHIMRDPAGKPLYTVSMIEDISERKRREQELRQLNRTLRALSNADHAMIQAGSEKELLNAACRIIVEDCGHPMVWIGLAGNDSDKTVVPVAQAGFEEGYLESVCITWSDSERGRGPTGTSIRTGAANVCRNMLTDPRMLPWRSR